MVYDLDLVWLYCWLPVSWYTLLYVDSTTCCWLVVAAWRRRRVHVRGRPATARPARPATSSVGRCVGTLGTERCCDQFVGQHNLPEKRATDGLRPADLVQEFPLTRHSLVDSSSSLPEPKNSQRGRVPIVRNLVAFAHRHTLTAGYGQEHSAPGARRRRHRDGVRRIKKLRHRHRLSLFGATNHPIENHRQIS